MKKNTLNISDVNKKIWEMELNYDLLNIEVKSVKIWQVIRFHIYTLLTQKLKLHGHTQTSNKRNDNVKSFLKIFYNSIVKSPMRGRYTSEIMIFDHPRKQKFNNKYIDIYTYRFIETLSKNQYTVIESPYLRKHYSTSSDINRCYSDSLILYSFIKRKISRLKLNSEEINQIKFIETSINKEFEVNMQLLKIIINIIDDFKKKYDYYTKLFIKRKPEKVYLVVSYSHTPIVAAAKKLGIETIEFQHGVITDYHFGYNFGVPTEYIDYFPDKILTFGDYWAHTKGFPKQTEIEVYGFPYLEEQLKKFKNTPKIKNQILILSQGTIGKELSIQIKEIAKQMPNYNFIYKLHPGEYDRWKNEYPDLVEASKNENLTVIDDNKKNLYSYLAESEFQIGVNSTAIFEGLSLGCKTILFDLQGIGYMNDLIKKKIVMLVNNIESCIKAIKTFEAEEFNKEYFFKSRKGLTK